MCKQTRSGKNLKNLNYSVSGNPSGNYVISAGNKSYKNVEFSQEESIIPHQVQISRHTVIKSVKRAKGRP